MFNVSVLLLDDALLKCVVSEVVLFSFDALKTLTFTHLMCGWIFSYTVITNVLLILRVT